MDDFWADLKDRGHKLWTGAKEFVADNKHVIYPLVTNLLSRVNPGLGDTAGTLLKTFGGELQS